TTPRVPIQRRLITRLDVLILRRKITTRRLSGLKNLTVAPSADQRALNTGLNWPTHILKRTGPKKQSQFLSDLRTNVLRLANRPSTIMPILPIWTASTKQLLVNLNA